MSDVLEVAQIGLQDGGVELRHHELGLGNAARRSVAARPSWCFCGSESAIQDLSAVKLFDRLMRRKSPVESQGHLNRTDIMVRL